MTRLLSADILDIPANLPAYDSELTAKTGCSLFQIACRAAGHTENIAREALQNLQVGIVPVTTGLGRLEGFCDAVAAVARHIGCRTEVSRQPDVAGIGWAIESGSDIIMMADEERFSAINLNTRKIADNAVATGRGFATALRLLADSSLWGAPVLVLGCGPVGLHAVKALLDLGCPVSIYDIDPEKSASLLHTCRSGHQGQIQRATTLEDGLRQHALLVDATPAGAFIRGRHIRGRTTVSAPGMPLGLDPVARAAVGRRLIHDPLQIGVATMLAMAATPVRHIGSVGGGR